MIKITIESITFIFEYKFRKGEIILQGVSAESADLDDVHPDLYAAVEALAIEQALIKENAARR